MCSLYELDEKPNYTKNSKYLKFEGEGWNEKRFLKKLFDKKIVFNGFKMSNWGASHMCKKKSYQKTCLVDHSNSFLEFLGIYAFLVINQNIHTQFCMNVNIHHHHMNYFKLDQSIFLT